MIRSGVKLRRCSSYQFGLCLWDSFCLSILIYLSNFLHQASKFPVIKLSSAEHHEITYTNNQNSSQPESFDTNSGWLGYAISPIQPEKSPKSKASSSSHDSDAAQESYSIGILIKPTKFIDQFETNANETRRDYQVFQAKNSNDIYSQANDKLERNRQLDWQATDLSHVIQVSDSGKNFELDETNDHSGSKKDGHSGNKLRDREQKGSWTRSKNGQEIESESEKRKGKDGNDWIKNLGHNKHGWRNVYHKEEYADHRKFHDVLLDKNWAKQKGFNGSTYDGNRGVQYDETQSGSFHDKDKHGSKFDYQRGDDWKRTGSENGAGSSHYDSDDHELSNESDQRLNRGQDKIPSASSKVRDSTNFSLWGHDSGVPAQMSASNPTDRVTQADKPWMARDTSEDDDQLDDDREIERMKERLERLSRRNRTNRNELGLSSENGLTENYPGDDWSGPRKSTGNRSGGRSKIPNSMESLNEILDEPRPMPDSANQIETASKRPNIFETRDDEQDDDDDGDDSNSATRMQVKDSEAIGKQRFSARKPAAERAQYPTAVKATATTTSTADNQPGTDAGHRGELTAARFNYTQIINSRRQRQPNISEVISIPRKNKHQQQTDGSFTYNRNVSAESRHPSRAKQLDSSSLQLDRVIPASGKPVSRNKWDSRGEPSRGRLGSELWRPSKSTRDHFGLASSLVGRPPEYLHPGGHLDLPNGELLFMTEHPNVHQERDSLNPSDLILLESAEASNTVQHFQPVWPSTASLTTSANSNGFFHSTPPLLSALNDHLRLVMSRRPRFLYPNHQSTRTPYNRMVSSLLRAASMSQPSYQYPQMTPFRPQQHLDQPQLGSSQYPYSFARSLLQSQASEPGAFILDQSMDPSTVTSEPQANVWMTRPGVDFDIMTQAATPQIVFKSPLGPFSVQSDGKTTNPLKTKQSGESKHSARRLLVNPMKRDNKSYPKSKQPKYQKQDPKPHGSNSASRTAESTTSNLIRRSKNVKSNFLVFG